MSDTEWHFNLRNWFAPAARDLARASRDGQAAAQGFNITPEQDATLDLTADFIDDFLVALFVDASWSVQVKVDAYSFIDNRFGVDISIRAAPPEGS